MSHHPLTQTNTHCQNCAVELNGPYCHRCGQKDVDFHRSFGHVVHELLETWLHLDHSFFQGLYNMLFRLGKTTREFNTGMRARHVPPFRFYLVVSLLFFFLVFPSHDALERLPIAQRQNSETTATHHAPEAKRRPDATSKSGAHGAGVISGSKSVIDLEPAIAKKMQHPIETATALLHAVPKALLVCVPLFAVVTRVLFRKSEFVYIQHLILAFNLHSFIFLWSATTIGWTRISGMLVPSLAVWLIVASALFTFWTYYRTIKEVFERSWRATLVLGTLAGAAYVFLVMNVIFYAAIMVFMF